jgi:D,D-heptose 1,7-bisphosphate phosphatase
MPDKAIFLDRDDTLIEDLGYINNPDQVKLLDGVPEALSELRTMGYKLIVASNQSAVARGIVSEKALEEIHNRLREVLARKGAYIDRIYYCPYHPDGVVPRYRRESDWRKPNPGMFLAAAKDMSIDLNQSWVVGNSDSDIEAGLRAGCKTILISHPALYKKHPTGKVTPDYKAVNMKEAVNIIKQYHRSTRTVADSGPAQPSVDTRVPDESNTVAEPFDKFPEQSTVEAQAPQEQAAQQQSAQPPDVSTAPRDDHVLATEELLTGILDELRRMRRSGMFSEFSIMRLVAGVVQIAVLFCLLVTVWLLMDPDRKPTSVFVALGFAILLQLMALTFYIMRDRRQ